MVAQSPADMGEILRKGDFVALRDPLENWSPPALVRVIADFFTTQ